MANPLVWLREAWRRLKGRFVRARIVTVPSPEGPRPLPVASGDRFVVERDVPGMGVFHLYDGPHGGIAKAWWEHVVAHKEAGTMRFLQNGVVRDAWPKA